MNKSTGRMNKSTGRMISSRACRGPTRARNCAGKSLDAVGRSAVSFLGNISVRPVVLTGMLTLSVNDPAEEMQ